VVIRIRRNLLASIAVKKKRASLGVAMPLLALVALLALAVCDGQQGPTRFGRLSRLVDLSSQQREQLCAAQPLPAGSDGAGATCPGDASAPPMDQPGSCRMTLETLNPSCGATVAQWQDCAQALAEHPCEVQLAFDTDSCRAIAGCDPTPCSDHCASVCQSPDAGGADSCLTSCFAAINGLSRPCALCVAAAGTGACAAMTFASPDSDACRIACGSGAVD
jgi:hypothetical protein